MKHTKNTQKFLHQISFRVLLLATFAILLWALSFFFVMIPKFEQWLIEKKREMLKEVVQIVYSQIEAIDKQYKSGEITFKQAQDEAIYHINNLRYWPEKKDYFWINDITPKMIVHPYRPDLIGKDLSHFQDEKWKLLFVDFVEVAKKDWEWYVDYMWQWKDNKDHIVPKISFVKEFKQRWWIIGSGLYIDDVKKEIANTINYIVAVITGVMTIVTLVSSYAIWISFKIEKNKNLAEQKLFEKEKQYRDFIEHTSIWVYRRGKHNEILMANPAFYKILSLYLWEDISTHNFFKKHKNNDDIIQTILISKSIVNKELKGIKKDGSYIRLSLNIIVNINQKWDIEYFDGLIEDISSRKQVEEKLKELDDKKNEFIGIVSHELRTPLTSIKGYLDMILDGDYWEINNKMKETIEGLYHNADRLINLVNDMLDITKLEAGKIEFYNEKISLNELIIQIFETYKNIAQEKQIDFVFEWDKNVFIFTDKQKLSQIIINLISNAFKFSLVGGKVILKTVIIENKIELSVNDSWVWIDESDYEAVFSKFWQVNNILNDKQKWTWLGLFIVKELLLQMWSEIHLTSNIWKWSTFSFCFPIYKQ